MSKINYNMFALQGQDMDDLKFRDEMKEAGVNIPIELVNTPDMNKFVIEEMYNQNINDLVKVRNPETGEPYTSEEAKAEAGQLKSEALANVRALMKYNKLK